MWAFSAPRLIWSEFKYIYTPGLCDDGFPCPGESSVSSGLSGFFWVIGSGDVTIGQGNDNGSFEALAGWITSDVVGPFKGAPGTGHW